MDDAVRKSLISTDMKAAREAAEQVVAVATDCGYSDDAVFAIKLALEEALTNAIKHGNQRDPAKTVSLEYEVTPTQAEIRIADQGVGFDPAAVPDPTIEENIERPCGRGIMLMRAYMDCVEFTRCGSAVRMVKFST